VRFKILRDELIKLGFSCTQSSPRWEVWSKGSDVSVAFNPSGEGEYFIIDKEKERQKEMEKLAAEIMKPLTNHAKILNKFRKPSPGQENQNGGRK
jgi:hypothetical protein